MGRRELGEALDVEFPTFRTQFALFLSLAVFTHWALRSSGRPSSGWQAARLRDLYVGSVLTLSALLIMVSAPAWGYLSERIGRRPVLLIALAGGG